MCHREVGRKERGSYRRREWLPSGGSGGQGLAGGGLAVAIDEDGIHLVLVSAQEVREYKTTVLLATPSLIHCVLLPVAVALNVL